MAWPGYVMFYQVLAASVFFFFKKIKGLTKRPFRFRDYDSLYICFFKAS